MFTDPAWVEHQRKRWLKPDWQRWMRHDAHRFLPPGEQAALRRAHWANASSRQSDADGAGSEAERRALQNSLLEIRRELAGVKFELAWRKLCRKYGYNPNQPRVPKGNPDGGEWTNGEAEPGRVRLAQADGVVTDAFGNPYYQPGGHHEMARQVYEKWNLQPETQSVFKEATTGKLPPMVLRSSPDGVPVGNFWNGPNGAHGQYNQAVKELSDSFLKRNQLKPEDMTPNQARELLKEIRESSDPRIRDFNNSLRLLRRLFPLRAGRGIE